MIFMSNIIYNTDTSEIFPLSSNVDIKKYINKYDWFVEHKMAHDHGNKSREIKHSVWPKYIDLNRKKEVIFDRLRFGDTKLTRRHLMAKTIPMICSTCITNYTPSNNNIIIHWLTTAQNSTNLGKTSTSLTTCIGPFSNYQNIIL